LPSPGSDIEGTSGSFPSLVTTAQRVYCQLRMSTERGLHYTYAEYLDLLALSPNKLEYRDGKIDAVPDGTPTHADLAAAATYLLVRSIGARSEARTEGDDCRVSSSDLKVRIEAADLATFPDVSVVCGAREVSPIDANAVTNPTLLVEVTSPST
jgi:Uma2 family endonuclease